MADEKHLDELTTKLVGNPDANDWADLFVETVGERPEVATDRDTMVGWFANAIMAGWDTAARRNQEDLEVRVIRSGRFRWEGWAPRPAAYSGFASAGFAWTYGGALKKARALRKRLLAEDPLDDVPVPVLRAATRAGTTVRRKA